jgi:hypothetical protein
MLLPAKNHSVDCPDYTVFPASNGAQNFVGDMPLYAPSFLKLMAGQIVIEIGQEIGHRAILPISGGIVYVNNTLTIGWEWQHQPIQTTAYVCNQAWARRAVKLNSNVDQLRERAWDKSFTSSLGFSF